MQVIDLFSGIGGFSLAGRWAGWNTIQFVEIDKFCQMVLKRHWPNVPVHSDIKTFGIKTLQNYNANETTVLTGGFPCQGFSVAGQRKGKSDDRYLWPEMLRVINEVKPTYIVGENVTGIISLALDTVLSDLEAQGYTTETFIIPACGKNAWHRRDRVWIIAYTNGIGRENVQEETGQPIHNGNRNGTIKKQSRGEQQCRSGEPGSIFSNTASSGARMEEHRSSGQGREQANEFEPKILRQENGQACSKGINSGGGNVFTNTTAQGLPDRRSEKVVRPEQKQEPERCSGISTNTNNTGCDEQRESITEVSELFAPKCSSWWEVEPGMGRVVTRLPHRVDRLKGLGNAVVPQVVYEIFMAINKHNETHTQR